MKFKKKNENYLKKEEEEEDKTYYRLDRYVLNYKSTGHLVINICIDA